ncbi:hypothetical protein D3C72_2597290 [compost metagenome]
MADSAKRKELLLIRYLPQGAIRFPLQHGALQRAWSILADIDLEIAMFLVQLRKKVGQEIGPE